MNIRTRKSKQQGVPIVPMLDILTILLIFFIVQTEFKHQTSILNLKIPQTEHIVGEKGNKESILLELDAQGGLALAGKRIEKSQLKQALLDIKAKRPDLEIQFSASEEASMGELISIIDELQAAGLDINEIPMRIDYQQD